MKTSFAFALGLILASASISHAQQMAPAVAVVAAPLSAAQILEKSRFAYASFSSYKGSCSVVSDAVYAEGYGAPTQDVSSASAQIEFERGKRLSVEGTDSGGSPFKALWTPGDSYIEQVKRGATIAAAGEIKRTNYKDKRISPTEPQIYSALDGMTAGLTGFTGGTTSLLPALLQDNVWSKPFPSHKSQLELLPARNLGVTPCYIIVATSPKLNSVSTYWIEQKTFLLRRLTEEQGERRYDDMPAIDGKPSPVMRVAYSLKQYAFATTEAK